MRDAPFRPRHGLLRFGPGAVAALAAIAFATALVVAAPGRARFPLAPPEIVAAATRAERTFVQAAEVIRDARHTEGVPSEAGDPEPTSALIGAEMTPLTTTLGSLASKQVATSPSWASALTVRLRQAGLRRGDVVAAGLSGSFPGLNLALVAACQSLDLRLLAISSVTASSWGANQPGFTWPEMEARLVKAGVIRRASIAVTLGAGGDAALDLEPDARAEADRIGRSAAAALAIPLIEPRSFHDAVAARLNAYDQARDEHPVRLYANVGGTEASLGRSAVVLHLRNGFLPGVPFDFSTNGGVMARYAERGVPLLTLLNVRDLAIRWHIL